MGIRNPNEMISALEDFVEACTQKENPTIHYPNFLTSSAVCAALYGQLTFIGKVAAASTVRHVIKNKDLCVFVDACVESSVFVAMV